MNPTILDAMDDTELFARWFRGDSWRAWRVFLSALFGLNQLDSSGLEIYRTATGRELPPNQAVSESWICVGRRGGKSLIVALIAVYMAFFRSYEQFLAPGEVGTVMVVAADRKQARVIMRFIRAFIMETPMLAAFVTRETRESIDLSNRVVIEVHTASSKSVRGYTLIACVNDEICAWPTEESSEPDREVIGAQRPALATIPGALMLCISSPHARKGCMWESFKEFWGKDSSVLFWKAPSRCLPGQEKQISMNPKLDLRIVEEAYKRDASSALAEFGAEFRSDIEALVPRESIDACVFLGRLELPPSEEIRYFGFVDPSGGRSDSMTLAISHRDKDGKAVLDCLRERRPPFSPESVTEEFSQTLRDYRIGKVVGDKYAGEWPRERFRVHGIHYETADKTKSELYLELLPLLNSGRVELPDNSRLATQLCGLERRTSRVGRDSVDHAPGSHDDLANVAAGALVLAVAKPPAKPWVANIRLGIDDDERGWTKVT